MRFPTPFLLAAAGVLAACADGANAPTDLAASRSPGTDQAALAAAGPGAVYTLTNAPGGNAVLAYPRRADGSLGTPTSVATGGAGTGAGLGNQGALALSRDGRWLAAVDAGSDEVTLFRVHPTRGLTLASRTASGGDLPISVTLHGDLLYVLNNGGTANVTGFRIAPSGALSPIPGSTQPLSTASPAAAQVQFSPDGSRLVVTEKGTNRIVTYAVDADGVAGAPSWQASSGQTPFGFGFTRQGLLVVSEAFGGAPDASAVSSYRRAGDGFGVVSPSVGTTETAACWIAITPNGRFAYTTNTGSGSVTGYAIGSDGSLALLDADGRTGETGAGSGPIDAGLSSGGRFLYVLGGGSHAISGFAVGPDGALTPVGSVTGLPAGANGLAVR